MLVLRLLLLLECLGKEDNIQEETNETDNGQQGINNRRDPKDTTRYTRHAARDTPQATGNTQRATGNRQQATGNKQQATGNNQDH